MLTLLEYCRAQELAGHKLSQAVIDRLPTLCTLTPGGKISYSEVIAFHNVIRGAQCFFAGFSRADLQVQCRNGHGRAVRVSASSPRVPTLTSLPRIIREATRKSKDGRIDQSDFMNHCVSSTRYSLFTPMEASIIFHFAGRGAATQRLALIDFAQLLDPRWRAPAEETEVKKVESAAHGVMNQIAHSAYNFLLGGIAGAFGATIVYPIDLGES